MKDSLKPLVDQMMAWHQRTVPPVFLGATCVVLYRLLLQTDLKGNLILEGLLGVVLLATILWATVCSFITLWHVYATAQAAFGGSAGIGYVAVALVLLFLPGVLVVPLMVRADISRYHADEPP